jgi:hypothetical protein
MSKSFISFRRQMMSAKLSLVILLSFTACACDALTREESTGVIIAQRAQIRSSTAVVAADLKEVVRNETVDILDSITAENGEHWLQVRTRDAENIEGWIEARNVMPQEMLERSRRLAKEDEGTPAQASGQLRASTNIRFTPDRSDNKNILMKLESGARFDIVGWKRVPKPKSLETTESDDVPKAGAVQQEEKRESGEPKMPEEANELWYKVRLSPSTSPAPAGWIYGKQVELTVPSDIIFYRTGREFVAWQRLDGDAEGQAEEAARQGDGDAATKTAQPGSWVILEKSSIIEPNKLDVPDFDRIYVLGYDKDRQEHYTVYRSPDLEGFLPLHLERGGSDGEIFTIRLQHNGELTEARYKVHTDDRGLLRVEPLNEVAKSIRKK